MPTILDKHRTESLEYEDEDQQQHFLKSLHGYMSNNEFSDVTVEVEGTKFHGHRIILASSSPYFKALFLHENKGSETVVLHLPNLPAVGFSALLCYMYSGKLTVTSSDAIEILEAADFLQFRSVVDICSSMLLQQITLFNCLRISNIANQHSCHGLHEAAHAYCLEHFSDLMQTGDFLELSLHDFLMYLNDDHLHLEVESDLLAGIAHWCQYDVEERSKELDTLLRHVRLWKLKIEEIQLLVEENDVLQKSETLSCRSTFTRQTKRDRSDEVVIVVKKQNHYSETEQAYHLQNAPLTSQTIWYYHREDDKWYRLTNLPFGDRGMYSVAVLRKDVFFTGGQQNGQTHDIVEVLDDVWVYSVREKFWSQGTPMLRPRVNHSSAVLLDKLYVVGGKGPESGQIRTAGGEVPDSNKHLRKDGEVYDPATEQWTMLPDIQDINGIGRACLVPVNEKLYLIGGMCSYFNEPMRQISWKQYLGGQCYDPANKTWKSLDGLSKAIAESSLKPSGDGCLSYLGFILFLDEDPYSHNQRTRTAKLYNPLKDTLVDFIPMKPIGRFGGYTMLGGEIVKTGGMEGRLSTNDHVYSCNLEQDCADWNMWRPLPWKSSNHACLTVFMQLPLVTRSNLLVE